jgi:hypothetical protein
MGGGIYSIFVNHSSAHLVWKPALVKKISQCVLNRFDRPIHPYYVGGGGGGGGGGGSGTI